MFTSLFSFSAGNLSYHEFSRFFLFAVIWIGPNKPSVTSWISQTAKTKSIMGSFSVSRIFWIDSSKSTY